MKMKLTTKILEVIKDKPLSTKEIAELTGTAPHVVARIAHKLATEGVLSIKYASGGTWYKRQAKFVRRVSKAPNGKSSKTEPKPKIEVGFE